MARPRPFPQQAIAPQGAAVAPPSGATLEVTYIANEGVLVAAGETQVLIDGLHRAYEPEYPFLPDPHREQLETARPPFDGIDLILVSHRHLDHFHPESVARYLRHNPTAVLVSSEQIVEEIRTKTNDFATIAGRVTATTPPLRQRRAIRAGGVELEMLGVGHGTGRHKTIQNLGHIIKLGGRKLLHLGDADTDATIFGAFKLDEEGIDIAFLPMWFLTEDAGAAIVRDQINPKHIVAVHMPTERPEHFAAEIKKRFPDAVAFTVLLDKRYY
jgi:L-ascorbate metabolism protein UlaG (beta-lactamase superfamily)